MPDDPRPKEPVVPARDAALWHPLSGSERFAVPSRADARRVIDPDRPIEVWQVYERRFSDPPRIDLVFESSLTIRRVSRYPAHWRELPDADLLALSRGR